MSHRYLVVTEGESPSTAEPLVATGDARLVSAALAAVFANIEQRDEARGDTERVIETASVAAAGSRDDTQQRALETAALSAAGSRDDNDSFETADLK